MTLLFMGIGAPEILLIAFVVLLLFGAKKIPDLMKSMGKGVKSFKEGVNGLENAGEEKTSATENKAENKTE